MLQLVALVLLPGSQGYAYGAIITAEGRSPIGNNVQEARQSALEDALRNALLKTGGQVNSQTGINNGVLVSDRIRLQTSGRVSDVEVLGEYQRDGLYVVNIRAVVADGQDCRSPGSAQYNKDVLVTGFPRDKPESSQVGQLHNIDTDFSAELSRRLYPAYHLFMQDEPSIVLANRTRYASPTLHASEAVKSLASKYQVQMVVGGSIVDMSMLYPEDYSRQTHTGKAIRQFTGLFKNRNANGVEADVRARHFALRLVIYDGVSGFPIFDKNYADTGIWDARFTEVTGFGTPRFWKTAYGGVVSALIDNAVNDAGQKINCQPFMVPARLHGPEPGNTLYIFAGANHGVKTGDSFTISSLNGGQFPGLNTVSDAWPYPAEYKSLQAEKVHLTIDQVYPTYSIGTSNVVLGKQQRYLAISW